MRRRQDARTRLIGLCVAAALVCSAPSLWASHLGEDAESTETSSGTSGAPLPSPSDRLEWARIWLAPAPDHHRASRANLEHLAAGIRLVRAGKHTDALPRLLAARSVETGVEDYVAYYAALAQLGLGRREAALRGFRQVGANEPQGYLSQAAAMGEAEAAEALGDFTSAERAYRRVLAQSPRAPDVVWMRLGKASLSSGDRAAAAEAFERVRRDSPTSPHWREATAHLVRLGKLEPLAAGTARFSAELARSEALFATKRYSDARAGFDLLRAHAVGAEFERMEVRRAACHYFLGQYGAARAALQPYRRRGAHQAEARFYDLMAARNLGADEEFVRLARELVHLHGGTTWAEETLDALGTHFIRRNRDQEADASFRELLVRAPTSRFSERAAWKVGWRAYRAGSLAESVTVFESAAATFPHSSYRAAYLYWAGRGWEALGDRARARAHYSLVRTEFLHSYYGRLAANRISSTGVAIPVSLTPAPETDPGAATPPTAVLIRHLLEAGAYDDAHREVEFAKHKWGDSPVLQATTGWIHHQRGQLLAGAAAVKRAYPGLIGAAGDALPREVLAVAFPVGFWGLIREHAEARRIDPHLLASLIAQESGFVPDIRSSAKATGLMQLMPATAQHYARRLAIAPYGPGLLTRPDTNIRMGTAYLSDLLREFGDAHLALASYNAGESRVRRWIAERQDLSPDEFVEDIPFPETQNYVKKILGSVENYRRVHGTTSSSPSHPTPAIPRLASQRGAAAPRGVHPPPPATKKSPPAKTTARPSAPRTPATDPRASKTKKREATTTQSRPTADRPKQSAPKSTPAPSHR